jgi:hypothetical protein
MMIDAVGNANNSDAASKTTAVARSSSPTCFALGQTPAQLFLLYAGLVLKHPLPAQGLLKIATTRTR